MVQLTTLFKILYMMSLSTLFLSVLFPPMSHIVCSFSNENMPGHVVCRFCTIRTCVRRVILAHAQKIARMAPRMLCNHTSVDLHPHAYADYYPLWSIIYCNDLYPRTKRLHMNLNIEQYNFKETIRTSPRCGPCFHLVVYIE